MGLGNFPSNLVMTKKKVLLGLKQTPEDCILFIQNLPSATMGS